MNTNTLPEANYREFFLWLLRQRKRLQVTGNSMSPFLKPNEEILVAPSAYKKSLPSVGDVVVLLHPHHSELIVVKRIAAIDLDNNCFLIGDNLTESKDSRHWGSVKYTNLIGKVTSRF